jgi:glycosyltransferase involved in cell wall biosynthesis
MLKDLPAPPAGKKGWPWTKESKVLPAVMPDGSMWPKISIVTPSFNQGQFLEETIRSVLLQNYPNLEYIIMDGGSADNSVEIIKKYEKHLSYWISEKDNGQSDAIYRGFEKTTGKIIAWTNSDDYYLPGTFEHVAKIFSRDKEIECLIGTGGIVKEDGEIFVKHYSYNQNFDSLLCAGQLFVQNACFWKRDVFFEIGGFDRCLQFCFDYDMFLRFAKRKQLSRTNRMLCIMRLHEYSKNTMLWDNIATKEIPLVQRRHGIETITESVRSAISRKTHKDYHINKRRGILKDVINDPRFFLKMVVKKIRNQICRANEVSNTE